MPYATVSDVEERTSFQEIAELTQIKTTTYIERAESWIHRATGRKFRNETDEDILTDLKNATVMLVEYLWYWDNPDIKEATMGPYSDENIGSYSYQFKNLSTMKSANPGEETGIKELDNILASLKVPPVTGFTLFSVSGPSRDETDEI